MRSAKYGRAIRIPCAAFGAISWVCQIRWRSRGRFRHNTIHSHYILPDGKPSSESGLGTEQGPSKKSIASTQISIANIDAKAPKSRQLADMRLWFRTQMVTTFYQVIPKKLNLSVSFKRTKFLILIASLSLSKPDALADLLPFLHCEMFELFVICSGHDCRRPVPVGARHTCAPCHNGESYTKNIPCGMPNRPAPSRFAPKEPHERRRYIRTSR